MNHQENDKLTPHGDRTCSTGIGQEISVLLIYLFGWVGGLVFLVVEKQNRAVRFHAMQSLILSLAVTVAMIALTILSTIPLLGLIFLLLSPLVALATIALIVFIIAKSFNGQDVELPVIADLAKTLLQRV